MELQQQTLSWSHLPDVCLLLIFKKLSMSDMIRSVGRVCTNWGKVQKDELRSRNTLVIATEREMGNEGILEKVRQYSNPFGSNLIEHVRHEDGLLWAQLEPLDQIEFNTLRVPSNVLRTEAFTSLVMDTLPNITHLTLVMYVPFDLKMSSLHQLTRLISHYTTSLVSLKLDLESDFRGCEFLGNFETLVPLFNSMNRLESLRHLRLNITNFADSYPSLSLLSRLATFTSDESYPVPSLLASLRQYATNGDNPRIECDTEMELEELIEIGPQLATKFTRLNRVHVKFNHLTHSNMRLFCQRFVSLHSLGLTIWGIPMTKLARYLSQLPELINLKVIFYALPKDEVDEDGLAQLEFTQMPSVRLLTLDILTDTHHDTTRLHLHQIFPNLQVLHFTQHAKACYWCFHGSIFNVEMDFLRTRIGHCMHLARQPFRQCANLHTVKLDIFHTADEEELRRLLPQGLITRDQL